MAGGCATKRANAVPWDDGMDVAQKRRILGHFPDTWKRDDYLTSILQGIRIAAGRLPARFVIHAAVMGQDLKTSAGLIDLATAATVD